MKNIHILPTDKPSRLHLIEDFLIITNEHKNSACDTEANIYITNDEEIKEGDWMYYKHFGEDIVTKYNTWGGLNTNVNEHKDYYKKIILTTDPDLIKDGVQAIDDDFLEWFVKNPSCEEVEVKEPLIVNVTDFGYKIIIPKEEPKQETLEEAAEQYVIDESFLPVYKEECERSFKNGALWQAERIYSELELFINEVKDKIDSFEYSVNQQSYISEYMTEWFEQFKKK